MLAINKSAVRLAGICCIEFSLIMNSLINSHQHRFVNRTVVGT